MVNQWEQVIFHGLQDPSKNFSWSARQFVLAAFPIAFDSSACPLTSIASIAALSHAAIGGVAATTRLGANARRAGTSSTNFFFTEPFNHFFED